MEKFPHLIEFCLNKVTAVNIVHAKKRHRKKKMKIDAVLATIVIIHEIMYAINEHVSLDVAMNRDLIE
jgi:hypothetical protein